MSENLVKTALYNEHRELGAKILPFAGYKMPISYSNGIKAEHYAVRNSSGIFDVSHMGQFFVSGKESLSFLQKMTINDVSKLQVGDAQYSAMCYEDGGIVDDLIVYRKPDGFFLVVNASNIDKDYKWLSEHKPDSVSLFNHSSKYSLIALQGPKSREILSKFTNSNINIKFYSYLDMKVCNKPVMLSRTGYTGELGYELYLSNDSAVEIWKAFMQAGAVPCGLAARDILRMEMKYCLYGNDIDKNTSPIEAGLSWITSLTKNDFIGKDILKFQKENKSQNRLLIPFVMNERGVPRKGYRITHDNQDIGYVTSGTQSISLGKGIGLGYVDINHTKIGNSINIIIRNKKVSAKIVDSPFVKGTSLHN